jgi:hypothetical protein
MYGWPDSRRECAAWICSIARGDAAGHVVEEGIGSSRGCSVAIQRTKKREGRRKGEGRRTKGEG